MRLSITSGNFLFRKPGLLIFLFFSVGLILPEHNFLVVLHQVGASIETFHSAELSLNCFVNDWKRRSFRNMACRQWISVVNVLGYNPPDVFVARSCRLFISSNCATIASVTLKSVVTKFTLVLASNLCTVTRGSFTGSEVGLIYTGSVNAITTRQLSQMAMVFASVFTLTSSVYENPTCGYARLFWRNASTR